MPSESPKQKRLMQLGLLYKQGKLDISKMALGLQTKIKQVSKMTDKQLKDFKQIKEAAESKWSKGEKAALIGSLATAGAGVSLIPSTRSMAKAYRAVSKGQYSEGVASYLEAGHKFGKSPIGATFRNYLSRIEKGRDRIAGDKGTKLDKVLDKIGPKDRFSNQHYIHFLSKNPEDGANFWVGIEAYGKGRGRLEEAAKQIYAGDKRVKRLDKDPLVALNKAIDGGILTTNQVQAKYRVPTYAKAGKPEFEEVSLKQLYNKYQAGNKQIDSVLKGVKDIKQPNETYHNAVRRLGKEKPELNPVFARIAGDKVPGKYYQKYTGTLSTGSIGFAGLGSFGALELLEKNKK